MPPQGKRRQKNPHDWIKVTQFMNLISSVKGEKNPEPFLDQNPFQSVVSIAF